MDNTDNRGIAITRNWEDIRRGGGRSLEIETISELLGRGEENVLTRNEVMKRTLDYFNSCIQKVEDEDSGELVSTWIKNPTKSGYALALGIDRLTLQTYINDERANKKPFNRENPNYNRIISSEDFDILRRAYSLIEEFYESKLGDNRNNAGVIFWLNNSNNSKWSNQQEFTFGQTIQERNHLTVDELPMLSLDPDGSPTIGNEKTTELPFLNDDSNNDLL